eukprot:scaffold1504_cov417-Prasinococcus_capsulatus_cf.AAC.47
MESAASGLARCGSRAPCLQPLPGRPWKKPTLARGRKVVGDRKTGQGVTLCQANSHSQSTFHEDEFRPFEVQNAVVCNRRRAFLAFAAVSMSPPFLVPEEASAKLSSAIERASRTSNGGSYPRAEEGNQETNTSEGGSPDFVASLAQQSRALAGPRDSSTQAGSYMQGIGFQAALPSVVHDLSPTEALLGISSMTLLFFSTLKTNDNAGLVRESKELRAEGEGLKGENEDLSRRLSDETAARAALEAKCLNFENESKVFLLVLWTVPSSLDERC